MNIHKNAHDPAGMDASPVEFRAMIAKSRGILLMLVGFLLFAQPSLAADVGRYQIIQGAPVLLVDSVTGKTWRLQEGQWLPMVIVGAKPVPPKPKETRHQRWQRESDARRLKLGESGLKPAPKPPVRKLLEKLTPDK